MKTCSRSPRIGTWKKYQPNPTEITRAAILLPGDMLNCPGINWSHYWSAALITLGLGLILFFLPHVLRELGLRDHLRSNLPSEGVYKGLYSVVALLGLLLIIWGKSQAPFIMIWQPVYEWRGLNVFLMLPALISIIAGNLPVSFIRRSLRHPMLFGVALWGFAHLWANGDLASMLLFGSFTIWALFKFFTLSPAAVLDSPARVQFLLWDIVAMLTGGVLFVVLLVYHGQIFGVGLSLN